MGNWKVIKPLDKGGMGFVFLATHQHSGEQAAIKVMLPEALASESAQKRFKKEISAMKQIDSLFVAKLLDYSDDKEFPWYALEFVSDFSLRDTIQMHGKFSDQAWWNLAKGILKAVDAIHSAGVIHRDLKPANIMMSKKGPKIIDFGLAKSFSSISSSTQTRRDVVMGTLAYMPPEQHEGVLYTTAKSDIFSIGITLAEAAGMQLQEIWRGDTEAQIIANKFRTSPNISKLTVKQQNFLEKMLKRTPDDRFSAAQLLKIIDQLSNEAINEEPPVPNKKNIAKNQKPEGHAEAFGSRKEMISKLMWFKWGPGFKRNESPYIQRQMNDYENKLKKLSDQQMIEMLNLHYDESDARRQGKAVVQTAEAYLQKILNRNKQEFHLGQPAQAVEVKPRNQIWPDKEFPIARPQDRVIAYLIDVGLFGISSGLVPLWFIFKSKGQLTPGRKFYQLLIIDSKTKKPVSGKRVLFRGLVLQYAVFTMIPFVSTTEVNGWYIFVSPILISLLMFLPARKNVWDFLTQTTVGKYQ